MNMVLKKMFGKGVWKVHCARDIRGEVFVV